MQRASRGRSSSCCAPAGRVDCVATGALLCGGGVSRTHVFVSTNDALVTFDVDAKRRLKTFDWVGGGTSPPAIGPKGQVYAIASNILFVFPPPLQIADRPTRGTVETKR